MSLWTKFRQRHHDLGFVLIAVWKLFRGCVLLLVSFWAVAAWHQNQPMNDHSALTQWCFRHLQAAGNHRFIHKWLAEYGALKVENLHLICIAAALYAVKLFIEGIGLWFEKVWAQYMTIIVTSLFLPFTTTELIRESTTSRLIVFLANLCVIAYLAWRLRQARRRRAQAKLKPSSGTP